MKNKWIFLLASCACFASCNKDDETTSENSSSQSTYAAEITAQAYGYTTAEGTTPWGEDASIGVYAFKAGTANIVPDYANVCYHADGNSFSTATPEEAICLPATGEAWDVAAYSPYSAEATATGKAPFSIADQAKLATDNILYARVGSLNNVGRKASLPMRPVLPQLTFSIQVAGTYSTSSAQAVSVNLQGFPTEGVLDITDGSVSVPEQATAANIALPTLQGEPERENTTPAKTTINLKAVVLPATSTGGYKAQVHVPNIGDETIDLSRYQMAFSSGYHYLFTLSYIDGSLQVTVSASAIEDWGNSGNISGKGE